MAWTICKNNDCAKSDQCERFKNQDGTEIMFSTICKKSNNYKWFWQSDVDIVKVEETQ